MPKLCYSDIWIKTRRLICSLKLVDLFVHCYYLKKNDIIFKTILHFQYVLFFFLCGLTFTYLKFYVSNTVLLETRCQGQHMEPNRVQEPEQAEL